MPTSKPRRRAPGWARDSYGSWHLNTLAAKLVVELDGPGPGWRTLISLPSFVTRELSPVQSPYIGPFKTPARAKREGLRVLVWILGQVAEEYATRLAAMRQVGRFAKARGIPGWGRAPRRHPVPRPGTISNPFLPI